MTDSKNGECFDTIQKMFIFGVVNVDAAKLSTSINRQINNDKRN